MINKKHTLNISNKIMQACKKRVAKEMQELKEEIGSRSLKCIQIVEINEPLSAIFLFSGPLDSPYQGFWFRIFVEQPTDYPFRPPKVSFQNRIWNPYVEQNTGKIFQSFFQDWPPSMTTKLIILTISSLLSQRKISQDIEGFANQQAFVQLNNNYPYFCEHSKKICQTYCEKHQDIYTDQMREKPEQSDVKVQSHEIPALIKKVNVGKEVQQKDQNVTKRIRKEEKMICLNSFIRNRRDQV